MTVTLIATVLLFGVGVVYDMRVILASPWVSGPQKTFMRQPPSPLLPLKRSPLLLYCIHMYYNDIVYSSLYTVRGQRSCVTTCTMSTLLDCSTCGHSLCPTSLLSQGNVTLRPLPQHIHEHTSTQTHTHTHPHSLSLYHSLSLSL